MQTDGVTILSSDDALRLETLPESILIAGGGVIGVEWASMLSDFGTKVTIIEAAPRLIPGEDPDVSAALTRALQGRGVEVHTGASIIAETVKATGSSVKAEVKLSSGTITLHAGKNAPVCWKTS